MSLVALSISDRASRSGRAWASIDSASLVAEQVADHGGEDKGEFGMAPWYAEDVDAGVEEFLFPSAATTTGAALWARNMSISLAMSRALGPDTLGAHTMTSGSADKSICFLSSIESSAMAL